MAKNYNDIPLIGERLRDILREKNMKQTELAEYLGMNKDSVNRIIRKGYTNRDTLIKISEKLDCYPYYLCDATVSENITFAPFARWNYDFDDCIKGIIYVQGYNPSDFSDAEMIELKTIISETVDDYAGKHFKAPFSLAFWSYENKDDNHL